MFREIGELLSSEWVPIASTVMLWLLISDKKASEKLRAKSNRYIVYIVILGYCLSLIIDIIRIIIRNTG